MKRRFAVIMAALLIAAMAGCSQSGTSSTAEQSTAQSSADSSVAESAESEISEAESSVVSEVTSTESSDEKSDTSVAESSDNKSKTESSQSKTDDTSKKTDDTNKKTDNGGSNGGNSGNGGSSGGSTVNNGGSGNNGGSSKQTEVKATGVTLDLSSLSLTSGSTQELNAYILWSNGTSSYNGITWSTSNSGVASVSSSGYVTAKSAGTATITASYGSFSKSCTVTVKAASQPSSRPSGGGSNGNTGNGGSNNGGSGNGSSGNGGSTSKPSGGGSSGNGGSSDNGGSTSKPSGGSGNTETTPTVKDNSPQLTKAWLEANCNKVIASNGTVVYEIPQFVQYLNEYRAKEGQKSVTWHQVGGFTYKTYIEHLKESKNEYPAFMLSDEYPGCFDENGNIILTEAYFNKNILPKYSYNSMAEEAAHGQPHQYHSSCHFTLTPNMTINQYLEDIKNTAQSHYDNLTGRTRHEIYVVGCFRGGSFTIVVQ